MPYATPTRVDLRLRILRWLTRHPEGVPNAQMLAWVDSCTRFGGYTSAEARQTLFQLRHESEIACTNGLWHRRTLTPPVFGGYWKTVEPKQFELLPTERKSENGKNSNRARSRKHRY
jgi:hypothetical protein